MCRNRFLIKVLASAICSSPARVTSAKTRIISNRIIVIFLSLVIVLKNFSIHGRSVYIRLWLISRHIKPLIHWFHSLERWNQYEIISLHDDAISILRVFLQYTLSFVLTNYVNSPIDFKIGEITFQIGKSHIDFVLKF